MGVSAGDQRHDYQTTTFGRHRMQVPEMHPNAGIRAVGLVRCDNVNLGQCIADAVDW